MQGQVYSPKRTSSSYRKQEDISPTQQAGHLGIMPVRCSTVTRARLRGVGHALLSPAWHSVAST